MSGSLETLAPPLQRAAPVCQVLERLPHHAVTLAALSLALVGPRCSRRVRAQAEREAAAAARQAAEEAAQALQNKSAEAEDLEQRLGRASKQAVAAKEQLFAKRTASAKVGAALACQLVGEGERAFLSKLCVIVWAPACTLSPGHGRACRSR